MSTLRDTNVSTADEAAQAEELREAMIAELRELTAIRSDQVADAFRAVPRHLFAPGATLDQPSRPDLPHPAPANHRRSTRPAGQTPSAQDGVPRRPTCGHPQRARTHLLSASAPTRPATRTGTGDCRRPGRTPTLLIASPGGPQLLAAIPRDDAAITLWPRLSDSVE